MVSFRPATIEEAVESILRCITRQCRVTQLAWFTKEHGEAFANEVKSLVEAKYKKGTKRGK